MLRNKKKFIIYLILLLLWCILIYYFSNQESYNSDISTNKVIAFIIKLFNNDIDDNTLLIITKYLFIPIRKLAHFTEYLILGLLSYMTISNINLNNDKIILFSGIFGIIYAISDEIHQLFIYGRSGQVSDVILDSIGILTSLIIVLIVKRYIIKKKLMNLH